MPFQCEAPGTCESTREQELFYSGKNTNGILVNFTEKVLFRICLMLKLFKTRLRAAICVLPRIPTCAHFHMGNQTVMILHSKMVSDVDCKGSIHCTQRGQPSHAAVEAEGKIVLHHDPNQEQVDDSTEGLRRSERRRWFIYSNL